MSRIPRRPSVDDWPQTEFECEGECEHESEADPESEEFFRRLGAMVRRHGGSPALRRLARRAAHQARRAAVIGRVVGLLGPLSEPVLPVPRYEPDELTQVEPAGAGPGPGGDGEFEDEYEGDWEDESFSGLNPIRRVYPDALMEHLAHAAVQAESEAEAEAFLGALVPLAVRAAAPALTRAMPQIVRGVAAAGRTLLRSPATKPLVRAVPEIVRGTVADLAGQIARDQPLTGQAAARTLARHTHRVLSDPRRLVRTFRRSAALDRRYHRAAPPAGAGRTPRPRRRCRACGR